jgi:hypothetical protein
MTTLSVVGAPPRNSPRSMVLPMLSEPRNRMTSRTRSIGFAFQVAAKAATATIPIVFTAAEVRSRWASLPTWRDRAAM